jgi:tetratricopeptide (TPR) repeat protein
LSPRFSPCGIPLFFFVLLAGFALSAAMAAASSTGRPPDALSYRPNDPLNSSAFDHFYNLEYDQAVQEFDQVLQRHPDDPFAVNHFLTAILFRELYRMGALNTGEYASDGFVRSAHRPADEKVKQQINELVQRALKLEEKNLSANPNNVDALYARGVTRAQFATYTALVERAWFSALRNAVGARHDHERVLELNPGDTQAKLIVGAHNYVLGSLPLGVKLAAAMMGLAGSKEKGIEYLKQCAAASGESSVDAKILLVLFFRREHRYNEALQMARDVIPRYPRNALLALEEGNLLRAAGRAPEAASVYRKIWQAGQNGQFSGLHYEIAALSLGDLLRNQRDFSGAAAAYEQVSEAPHPDPEVLQRANLGAGEMYDLLHKRDMALARYQAVIATNANTPPSEIARRRMKDAYREE